MDNFDWLGIIGAISGLVTAIFVPIILSKLKRKESAHEHHLDRLDKEFDQKLHALHEEEIMLEKERQIRMSYIFSKIYSYLWELLYNVDADRISIVQPHPEDDRKFISISYEVLNPTRDVSSQKFNFQYYKMSEWASMIKKWIENRFIVYKKLEEISDYRLYPEASRRAIKSVVFVRLTNNADYWIGTLAIEYTHTTPKDFTKIKDEGAKIGVLISDILPAYQSDKKLNT